MDTESTAPAEGAAAAAPAQTDFEKWVKLPEEEQNAVAGAKAAPASETGANEPAANAENEETSEAEVPKGLQKRFRELTTKIKNLEAEAAAARAKAAASTPAPGATPPAAAPALPGKPQVEKFQTYEAYLEALTTWTVEQTQLQRERQSAARERNANWQKELVSARERHTDFDEVALTDLPINRATHEAIVRGGRDGADLAYYLGQHKDEAAEILKLSPQDTLLALGGIIAKLKAASPGAAAPVAVSRAPKPATPVAARGTAADREPDPSDFPKWQAWQRRQEAAAEAA